MAAPGALSVRIAPARPKVPWVPAAVAVIANALFVLLAWLSRDVKPPAFAFSILGSMCVLTSIYALFSAGARSRERPLLSVALRGASLLLAVECVVVTLRALKLL